MRQEAGDSKNAGKQKSKTFEDLFVWRKSHMLVLEIYKITKSFPQQEMYCLTSQMRRSAISIPANVVEGFRRKTKAEKLRFMNIAHGSLEELKYYLILSCDLGYITENSVLSLIEEVSKLIEGYSNGIRNSE